MQMSQNRINNMELVGEIVQMTVVMEGKEVPRFLTKLWFMVNDSERLGFKDPDTQIPFVSWTLGGRSFMIRDIGSFTDCVLPLFYKHRNLTSFVRQLNNYGFSKLMSVYSGLLSGNDTMEFSHPHFVQGEPNSLLLVKRRLTIVKELQEQSVQGPLSSTTLKNTTLKECLSDLSKLKEQHDTSHAEMLSIQRENESLWREIATLRQKHSTQTVIVHRLLNVLIGMMSPSPASSSSSTPHSATPSSRMLFKRRIPLAMLSEDQVPSPKRPSTSNVNTAEQTSVSREQP